MRRSLMILAAVLVFSVPFSQARPTHRFITHYISPFSYEEKGEFHGFAVDVVKEMMLMLDHPVSFEMFPFQRALLKVQTSSNVALFIVARRPEREHTIKWVGPLITSGVYFYKHKDHPSPMNSMEDLQKLQFIGVGRGNADHNYLIAQGIENLYPNNDHLISIQMLESRRIDATPMSELVMPEMAKQAGISLTNIERTDIKLYDSTLYLGFSLDVPDEIVKEWQTALDTLKANGRYEALYLEYIK